MSDGTGLPSQKELEKEISQYLAKKYGEQVKIVTTNVMPEPEKGETSATPFGQSVPKSIDFTITPEELIAYLDDYVICQEEAKAVLATKICTHFNRIRYEFDHPYQAKRNIGRIKSNVLLIGPTGVGKTFLIKLIADRIGVPFVKGDATKFSETGYVGGDVEDLVRDLVREADGNIERAQYGIIYVDEIDKIASSQERWGADVSRTGVQRAFLKPMEETEVDLKVPHDPISQLEAIERYRATGQRGRKTINTKNVLFIMSGAFSELGNIIRKRVQSTTMGFEGKLPSKGFTYDLLKKIKAEDLIQFGFESEFVGRLPIIGMLNELTEENLYEILVNPNSSVVVGKKQDFQSYGIKVVFEESALREIARKASLEQTGARGLVSVTEKILLPFEKRFPSTDIKKFVVSLDVVKNPEQELEKLLTDQNYRQLHEERFAAVLAEEKERIKEFILATRGNYLEEKNVLATPSRLSIMADRCIEYNMDCRDVCEEIISIVDEIGKCAEWMSENCDITVSFSDDAIDRLLAKKPLNKETINAVCKNLAKAYEYGLRLLSQKKGYHDVLITAEGIDAPDKFINDLVEKSFKL